jgi:hypothetical protein
MTVSDSVKGVYTKDEPKDERKNVATDGTEFPVTAPPLDPDSDLFKLLEGNMLMTEEETNQKIIEERGSDEPQAIYIAPPRKPKPKPPVV